MVPIMFNRLLKLPDDVRAKYDLSSLRFVAHAAAPCAPDVKRAMIDWWGPIINEYYGTTETGNVTFCTSAEWLAHPGTVGRIVAERRNPHPRRLRPRGAARHARRRGDAKHGILPSSPTTATMRSDVRPRRPAG